MAETRTVVVERLLEHPPEKIWRALTQPHLIAEWLMTNDFKPVPGHKFNLSREPAPDMKVVIDCEVLDVDEHRSLSYRWAAYGTDTVVTFTLVPAASGTVLRVEQAGFPAENTRAIKGSGAAWTQFLGALDALLTRTD
jgi:uncharacterized protein YndB with AHSA1/START domain